MNETNGLSLMNKHEFSSMLSDVSAHYAHPSDLWNDGNLTADQKIEALRNWEQDLRLIDVAADENMTPAMPDKTADLLKDVHNLLEEAAGRLTKTSAPTKIGGKS
jgi:hypothetical protein